MSDKENTIVDMAHDIINRPPSVKRIIVKILLMLIGILFWGFLFCAILEGAIEETLWKNDLTHYVSDCDEYFYQKKYEKLLDELRTFNLVDPVFDKYWEAAEGYADYVLYIQYEKAKAVGYTESDALLEEYRQRVLTNAENIEFSENEKQLTGYAEEILVK